MKPIVLKYLGLAAAVPILLYASFIALSGSGVAETLGALAPKNTAGFKEAPAKSTVIEMKGEVSTSESLDDELELPSTKGYVLIIRTGLEDEELQTTVDVSEGPCATEDIFKGRHEWAFKVDGTDATKRVTTCLRAAVDGLPGELVNRDGAWSPLPGTGDLNDAVTVLAQDLPYKDELGTAMTLAVLSSSWCSEALEQEGSTPHCVLSLSVEAVPLGAVPTLPLLTVDGKIRRYAFTGNQPAAD